MFKIITYFTDLLADIYERNADPRAIELPLVGPMLPVTIIIFLYLFFVKYYGPKWMKNRKPYDLKNVMIVYNAIQVLANVYIFYVGIQNSYLRKEFSFTCQPIDTTNTEPWMMNLVKATYWYYLTKYLDLLDTVFFVLRKKYNQITFLHVYHHAGMVFAVYVHMTFLAGSHATMLGIINLVIHTVMYSYYFATSWANVRATLWWKRHITELQLLQFGYLIIHFLMAVFKKDCTVHVAITAFGAIQNFFMFILFFDFYYKAYIKKSKNKLKPNEYSEMQKSEETTTAKIKTS